MEKVKGHSMMLNGRLTRELVSRHIFRNYFWYTILSLVLTLSITGAFSQSQIEMVSNYGNYQHQS